jgi:hypothetical protein
VGAHRAHRLLGTLPLALALAACGGGSAPPPEPGTTSGLAPDLRGRRVLVLPVQQNVGVRGDPDAEIIFALGERDVAVEWILPDEVEAALSRAPGVQASTRGLDVGQFLTAEVQRVGDPLYGELRRMSALVNAEAVLIPVQTALAREPGAEPTVRLWTVLLDVRSGRVLWFSVVDGDPHPAGDPRGLASAVDEVARSMLWYAGL